MRMQAVEVRIMDTIAQAMEQGNARLAAQVEAQYNAFQREARGELAKCLAGGYLLDNAGRVLWQVY